MSPQELVDVGAADDFPPGKMHTVQAAGRPLVIVRHEDAIYAFQNLCPHHLAELAKGTLSGTFLPSDQGEWIYGLEGLVVRCPRHAWEFDIRTGQTVCGTDRRRLVTFPATIEDGRVLVVVPVRRRRDAPLAASSVEQS